VVDPGVVLIDQSLGGLVAKERIAVMLEIVGAGQEIDR
jgi:hypothetical protein